MLRRGVIKELNLSEQAALDPVDVIWGDGSKSVSTRETKLGQMEAFVMADEDLEDNLISLNRFVKNGSTVLFEDDGGVIFNQVNSKTIPLQRVDGTWRIWLHHIQRYDTMPEPWRQRKEPSSKLVAQSDSRKETAKSA